MRKLASIQKIKQLEIKEKIDLLLSNENFNNGRVSFKAINHEFLLKHGE